MCPYAGYYDLMRQGKGPRYLRLKMVQLAKERGIKPAARLLRCSPNTVRKWLRRYDRTLASLECHSRAAHHRPNKLSTEAEKEILAGHTAQHLYAQHRTTQSHPSHHPARSSPVPGRHRSRPWPDGNQILFGTLQLADRLPRQGRHLPAALQLCPPQLRQRKQNPFPPPQTKTLVSHTSPAILAAALPGRPTPSTSPPPASSSRCPDLSLFEDSGSIRLGR